MAEYDKDYGKLLTVTATGIVIAWNNMPPKDVAGNLKVIRGAGAELKKTYKVSLTIKQNSALLTVEHKKTPANEDAVLILESIGCGLLPATRWGGP